MVKKVSTPMDEQETIINIRNPQVEERINVYTTLPATMNKLLKLNEKYPNDIIITKDDKYGMEFSIPRNWLSIRPARKYSEEQRVKMAERLANMKKNI